MIYCNWSNIFPQKIEGIRPHLRTLEREEGVQKPYLIFKYVLEIIERHRKMKKKNGGHATSLGSRELGKFAFFGFLWTLSTLCVLLVSIWVLISKAEILKNIYHRFSDFYCAIFLDFDGQGGISCRTNAFRCRCSRQ